MSEPTVDWGTVVEVTFEPPEAQALIGRRNFRIHVGNLLGAIAATAKAVTSAAVVPANPLAALKLGMDALGAILMTVKAVQESLPPGEFVACAVLSRETDGMTAAQLEAEMRFMCKDVPVEILPWYLGLTKEYLDKAHLSIEPPNTVHGLLKQLTDKHRVVFERDKYRFVDQAVEWRWT